MFGTPPAAGSAKPWWPTKKPQNAHRSVDELRLLATGRATTGVSAASQLIRLAQKSAASAMTVASASTEAHAPR